MSELSDAQKAAMGGGPEAVIDVGDAWTEADPPVREAIDPGVNSPEITGFGWRRMIRQMYSSKGVR